jgi:hypothetical protein
MLQGAAAGASVPVVGVGLLLASEGAMDASTAAVGSCFNPPVVAAGFPTKAGGAPAGSRQSVMAKPMLAAMSSALSVCAISLSKRGSMLAGFSWLGQRLRITVYIPIRGRATLAAQSGDGSPASVTRPARFCSRRQMHYCD